MKSGDKIGNLTVGDIIHLDPDELAKTGRLKIISKEEAERIAAKSPVRQFVITEVK